MKSLLKHDLKIIFHPWVMKSVCIRSFFVWGTFLWEDTWRKRQLCSVLAYDQWSSAHWAPLWCVVCTSCHTGELSHSSGGARVLSMGASTLPWIYPSAETGCWWWWADAQNRTPEASNRCHGSCQFCVYLGLLSTIQNLIPHLCWSVLKIRSLFLESTCCRRLCRSR